VSSAIEIIGSQARTEILRRLWVEGPSTAPELADMVGTNRMSAYRHLLALEEAQLVVADLAPTERTGRTVTWRVLPQGVEGVVATWLAYVTGGGTAPAE
jgi:predicted ArsR family transcriptional regulator